MLQLISFLIIRLRYEILFVAPASYNRKVLIENVQSINGNLDWKYQSSNLSFNIAPLTVICSFTLKDFCCAPS